MYLKKNSQYLQDDDWVLYVSNQGSTCQSVYPDLLSVSHVVLCSRFVILIIGSIFWVCQTVFPTSIGAPLLRNN